MYRIRSTLLPIEKLKKVSYVCEKCFKPIPLKYLRWFEAHPSSSLQGPVDTPSTPANLEKVVPNYLLPSEVKKKELADLKESILIYKNLDNIFGAYFSNKSIFDPNLYLVVLGRIAELHKLGYFSTCDLHQNRNFQSLCYDIWKIIWQLEANVVLNMYKRFIDIEVKSDFLIMQSLLQMMRHQINLYSVQELGFLHVLLKKTETCNLKQALQTALPIVLENSLNVHFPTSLKYKEYMQLLHTCIAFEVNSLGKVIHHLYVKELPKLFNNEESNSFNLDVLSLVSNLLDLFLKDRHALSEEEFELAKILLIASLDKLGERDLGNVDKQLIFTILSKLGLSFEKRNSLASNENFLSKVTEKALTEKWDSASIGKLIQLLRRLHFVSEELVEYFLSNFKGNIGNDREGISRMPLLIHAMSACHQDFISHHVLDNFTKILTASFEQQGITWFRLSLNLLAMNYFPRNLLKLLLEEKFLLRYLKSLSNPLWEYLNLLKLQRVLHLSKWDNHNITVPEVAFKMAQNNIGDHPYACMTNLLLSIIGPRFLSDLVTPRGNPIDHLIVLDKAGRPERCAETPDYSPSVLDWENLKDKKKVVVMEVPNSWVYKPGAKLEGRFKLEVQLLEEEGFDVVLLFENDTQTLDPEVVVVYDLRNNLVSVGVNLSSS